MEKTIKLNHLIFEQVKFRYDFCHIRRIYHRNRMNKLFLDTFYPYQLASEIAAPTMGGNMFLGTQTAQSGYAISERVALDMGAKKLHISELVTMLGYTKTDISKLLQSVKNKEYNITLVGVGGTGSNFLHWLYQMAEWTGKEKIFRDMHVYDDDDFDIPNMLRIPFLPEFGINGQDSKKVSCLPYKFKELANRLKKHGERLNPEEHMDTHGVGTVAKSIIYGAPDIATRSWLSASNYTFIAATHRDNEFSIVENPAVDDELMMETYGKINLSGFFLNHLTMTLEFLKHLRDRTGTLGSTEEVEILRANFSAMYEDQLIGGFKAGAKKLFVHTDGQQEDLHVEEA